MAALLHDVIEDTSVTKDEISDTFGKPVAELVDGVSKLDQIEFQSAEDAQAENFRKMLLAMARDVRVILIKLADRLHNMRTLDAVPPAKRRRVARETLEIYAPIANRLGLNTLYHELQELALLAPLPDALPGARQGDARRRAATGARWSARSLEAIKKKLADSRHRGDGASAARSTSTRIYRKMIEKHLSFSEVHDIFGFRVIVTDVPACYLALGALHALYKPIPGKFKDYIAIPKANGYQSLHTDAVRPLRHADRGADPHRADAPPRRGRRRLALAVQGRRRQALRAAEADPPAGCSRCSRSSTSRATRRSSSSTSRWTCSPTRSTCSRPRAGSCRCRAAPPRSTSPTRCTPTSATAAWRPR